MTTGFQQQPTSFGPILKTAARPQHMGAKLQPSDDRETVVAPEKRTFSEARTRR